MTTFSFIKSKSILVSYLFLVVPLSLSAQEIIAPPSLGQQTQGEEANLSGLPVNSIETDQTSADAPSGNSPNLLGTTQIVERRGENGQINRIELEHSSGSKQYIDRDYSDREIDSKPDNIEETPNLAKWRLGSW